jgi:hypothetical protein
MSSSWLDERGIAPKGNAHRTRFWLGWLGNGPIRTWPRERLGEGFAEPQK